MTLLYHWFWATTFVLIIICCLRIERTNGFLLDNELPWANTAISDQQTDAKTSTSPSSSETETETGEDEVDTRDFPTPSYYLTDMVQKARLFAQKYLKPNEIHKIREIVKYEKGNGKSTEDIRRAIIKYLNSIFNQTTKLDINRQRYQLSHDFGSHPTLFA